jgi:hypothetical protein
MNLDGGRVPDCRVLLFTRLPGIRVWVLVSVPPPREAVVGDWSALALVGRYSQGCGLARGVVLCGVGGPALCGCPFLYLMTLLGLGYVGPLPFVRLRPSLGAGVCPLGLIELLVAGPS